jgi:hypothetical protein
MCIISGVSELKKIKITRSNVAYTPCWNFTCPFLLKYLSETDSCWFDSKWLEVTYKKAEEKLNYFKEMDQRYKDHYKTRY